MTIKSLRESKNISKTQLAEATGIHYKRLTRIENDGAIIRADEYQKLAKAFKMSVSSLINECSKD